MNNMKKQEGLLLLTFIGNKKIDFFRFFGKRKCHSKLIEEETERIGAIPSIEDKTRTLPPWTIYIAWGCKFNQINYSFHEFSRCFSGYIKYFNMFIFHYSLFIGMGCKTSE